MLNMPVSAESANEATCPPHETPLRRPSTNRASPLPNRKVSACRIQTQLPAILLFLAVTLGRPPPSAAHVYLTVPPTRAKCYLDQRMGLETDELFRGNPCGRPSRGVLGALVAGTDSCVTARMPVAHPGHFRISIAPGTAGTGGTAEGRPAFATAFDSPGNILAAFDCSSLPGGCPTDAIEGQGDYTFPIRVPANLTAGVYTLQLRQYASEFDWYYYDCADVQVRPVYSCSGPTSSIACLRRPGSSLQ